MVLFYVISTVKWWCHLWTIFWRHGRPRVSIYLLYMCLFHCSSCRSQRWWHHQGVKLREVQIARKRTCQVSFQRVKKGRRSFTVGHTGIKYHNLSISSHLNQNYWHVFWNPFSGSLWKTTFGKITTSLNVKQSISTIPNFFQNFSFITLLPDCKAVNASFRRVTGNVGF